VRVTLTALMLLTAIAVPSAAVAASSGQATAPSSLTSPGGIGIRLVNTPTDALDLLARSYIVDQVAPGSTLHRRLEIRNSTRSMAHVTVYAAAADLRHGVFSFAAGHSRNELSSWTTVSRSNVRLPAGAGIYETVTIDVPKAASSGERYAVIWAEMSASAPTGGGVTLVNRIGVRMYVSTGPGGAPRANFAIGTPAARRSAHGNPSVVTKIRNNGKRTLELGGTLTLTNGPGGLRAGPYRINLGVAIAPNHSAPAIVVLDKRLPRGPWRVHIRLSSGFVQHSAAATITFPTRAG